MSGTTTPCNTQAQFAVGREQGGALAQHRLGGKGMLQPLPNHQSLPRQNHQALPSQGAMQLPLDPSSLLAWESWILSLTLPGVMFFRC